MNPSWRFITQASSRQILNLCSPRSGYRDMRTQLNKLTKNHSTKAERRFAETLKRYHIPFKTKVMIGGREIDFLVRGKYAFEIDGHSQDPSKNKMLIEKGYIPFHLGNWDIVSPTIQEWIKGL